MAAPATAEVASQILAHTSSPYTFAFTPFLQTAYQHSLPADRPICKAYSSGHCTLGTRLSRATRVVGGGQRRRRRQQQQHGRLQQPGMQALAARPVQEGGSRASSCTSTTCARCPECNFFVRNGYCSNGDECLYLHIDPLSKLPPCPHYERGFCELGPRCAKKHVRRKLCPYYLAGFCPWGRPVRKVRTPAGTGTWRSRAPRSRGGEAAADGMKREGGGYDDDDDREHDRDRDNKGERSGEGARSRPRSPGS